MTDFATPPPLFILRHGRTQWNAEGRLQGHLDSPLTELGLEQAHQQHEILKPVLARFPHIHVDASPLGRAWQTAQIALGDHPFHPQDAIKEVRAGIWEGRLRDDIAKEQGMSGREEDMFELFLNAPDGENADVLEARCRSYLETLTVPTIIVSHGVVSAFLRGLLQNMSLEQIGKIEHLQGVVTVIENGTETVLRSEQDACSYLA
jgi:probable phosphoglycerate mutase